MAGFLPSRAKVVTRSGALLLLFFTFHTTFSQDSNPANLTIVCRNCALSDVLAQIEAQTGLHFIYSIDKVQMDRGLTMRESGGSVDGILRALAQLTGFHFKRSGNYVIIKNGTTRSSSSVAASPPSGKAMAHAVTRPEQKFLNGDASHEVPDPFSPSPGRREPDLGDIVLKKPPLAFSQYFDAKRLPDLPQTYVRSLNLKDNHPGWFVSTGLFLNNHSAGAEIQAGLRSVFLIYRPAWLKHGRYLGSYGIGVSMLLNHNASWNMSYTYGTLGNTIERGRNTSGKGAVEVPALEAEVFSRHHAGRFMLRYAITRNISVQGGFSVNLLERHFKISSLGYAAASTSAERMPPSPGRPIFTVPQERVIVRKIEAVPAPSQTRMWLGWETSLSYRFNFFRKN